MKKLTFSRQLTLEKIAKENEVIGKAKGIVETGYEFGASEADILKRLQQKLEISNVIVK